MDYREQHDKAWYLVAELFKNKVDLGGKPYIGHIHRVTANTFCRIEGVTLGEGYKYKTTALLHDVLEDTDYTEKMLRMDYTAAIADAVVALTKTKGQDYWEYIQQVLKNEIACHVKLADLEDNMDIKRLKFLSKSDFKRLKAYHEAYRAIKQQLEFNKKMFK